MFQVEAIHTRVPSCRGTGTSCDAKQTLSQHETKSSFCPSKVFSPSPCHLFLKVSNNWLSCLQPHEYTSHFLT